MTLRLLRTSFDYQLHRALGDWQGEYNSLPKGEGRCPACDKFHEEPQLVLMALSGWNCQRAAKYEREVFDRCLNGAKFPVAYRRFRRLAPYTRIGAHTGQESDKEYVDRMYELKRKRIDFDQLLHSDELVHPRRLPFGLPERLWAKAQEIKKRYPLPERGTRCPDP